MKPRPVRFRAVVVLLAAVLGISLLPSGAAFASRAAVCANAPADVFRDVTPGSTHAAAIDCLAARGITVGVGGGNYAPTGEVTRAQMASFLVRFIEVATDAEQPPVAFAPFGDVRVDATHAANIRILAGLGVTRGTTPTTYAPELPVTRGQMASFVVRALGVAGLELPTVAADRFSDDDGSSHEDAINALAGSGVVRGVSADRFDPTGHVTRAQMATFLANASGLLAEQGQWRAPALTVDGARIALVTMAPGADDAVEVRWTEPVTAAGAGAAFEVTDETATEVVSRGTDVTAIDGRTLRVELDTALEPDAIHWLDAASGAVTATDGTASVAQQVAFTSSVLAGGGGAGGGTGGGAGGAGDEAEAEVEAAPTILSVATSPPNAIRVTFDSPVVCPSGAGALASWTFANTRTMEHDLQPDQVTQTAAPATTCDLVYAAGIVDGDYGALGYTAPADTAQQVRTAEGTPLASTTNVRVKDGVAPTFDAIDGHAQTFVVLLHCSEPIACATVSESQFGVTIGGTPTNLSSYSCVAPADTIVGLRFSEPLAEGVPVAVTIDADTTLSDASLDNRVIAQSRTLMPSSQG